MRVLLLVVFIVLAFAIYVRIAPSDPARWHVAPAIDQDATASTGAVRVLTAPQDDFVRLDQIIRATPRTRVLAGSVAEGQVTYITRSRLWGFPDYTTVDFRQGRLRLFGRLRFGANDLGVNAARMDAWIDALRQG